ncbi:ESF1 homolog [Ananas comosus]|uniref:ESF1 homolog n=1 Tax=Ananas comosus TaxID=4615 RepID=A0A6P5FRE5_ANACO|nr:ESF1 homolog [Ananas comosus]
MATTSKLEKKKTKKKMEGEEEPHEFRGYGDGDRVEPGGARKKSKKRKLQSMEVPEVSRVKDEKKKKKKKKDENREEDAVEEGEERRGVITDERFAAAQYDPRFRRMPRKEAKVTIDSRFARMFTDKDFAASAAPVDKRGRPRKDGAVNPMLHYYLQQDGEEEEGRLKLEEEEEVKEGSDESESDETTTTTTDEEEDDDDQYSVNSDLCRYLMANHDDTPMIENETHRLAVVNLDWDHIKAVDLYVVMTSCLPKGGQIHSVAVYPSEFGLKCMEIEAIHGPSGLFEDNDDNSEDDSDVDDNKLRSYELNKLRYYNAVVVCDSSATANHLYKTLDGTEFLKTSNVFDLRFIPDSVEFKHPPRDIATEAPVNYKEPDFQTRALQHSRVKLTWEDDEPERKKILRRKFNPNQLDEFNEYLASTDESDEDDDEYNNQNGVGNNDEAEAMPNGETKKRLGREKLLALLQAGDDSDSDKSDDKDMEITFNTELEDLSKRILDEKDKKSETVWEAVLRKRNEKKKARKNQSKHLDDENSDSDNEEAPQQDDDDFFVEEPLDSESSKQKKGLKGKKGQKGSRKDRDESPEGEKEREASRAELELLFADDQDVDQGPKGFNLKPKKVKGKKGKEKSSEDKLPNVDLSNDPRFAELFSSHLFALDPTDPEYKRSAAYVRKRAKKQGKDSQEEEIPEHNLHKPSKQDTPPPEEGLPNIDTVPQPSRVSLEKNELSSTILSLKRNLGTFKNGTKGR